MLYLLTAILSDLMLRQFRRLGGKVSNSAFVQIRVAAQTAVLVKQLRAAWLQMMIDKIRKPLDPMSEAQERIRGTIVEIMSETGT
jgi:hypothetical protein